MNTTYTYYSSIVTARKVGARLKLEANRDKKKKKIPIL